MPGGVKSGRPILSAEKERRVMMMDTLAGKDLHRYMRGHPRALLIDLRSRREYGISHIRGAVNVPYSSLEKVIERLPAGRELVFYCERGGSAMAAARDLSEAGFQTIAVIGAYDEICALTETVSGFNI